MKKAPRLTTRHTLLLAAPLALLAGCANLNPEALTNSEVAATVKADQQALAKDAEPLNGALTLEGAVARAIRHNAERRVRAMEEAVALGSVEVGNYDMLPKLVASAGYRDRDNDLISRSTDSITGAPSLANPSITSSRHALTSGLEFSWSLLDFGQSYYAARQSADRALIAGERRRKALHNLIQEVRTSYWRVVAAQKLRGELRSTIADAESALQDAIRVEQEKVRSPLEPLRFQRQLLENLRLLESIQQELSTARVELASLTGLPLSKPIEVVEPQSTPNANWLKVPAEKLEQHALMRNPDLREGIYNARIAQQETRRAMLKVLPGISFNYASRHSDDNYLVNQSWNEAGAQVSFNLLGVLSAPAQMRLADAGVALADQKRMATQIAVLTQLHVALLQYDNANQQFKRADAIAKVEGRISGHVNNQEQAEKQSKLDRVAQQTAGILAQLRRYQALSNAQTAASRLQATLGMEPAVADMDRLNLIELTGAIDATLKRWDSGRLPVIRDTAPATPAK
jgi:outer membrane protein TolC